MSQSLRVDIYCDGDEQIGYGHIRRSTALAGQLEKEGLKVQLAGLSSKARNLLPLPDSCDEPASVVIFDSPREIDDLIRSAVTKGQTTIALDWFGSAIPDVNIAIYPHAEVRAEQATYIGLEYVIVREEIRSQQGAMPSEFANRVLVCLGGGDFMRQGHLAAAKLCETGLDVTLVQGPLAADTAPDDRFRVVINPQDLPTIMASADWTVTNGGTCLFEALCIGKAAVVLPQTESESKIAAFAQKKGAVLGMGMSDLQRYKRDEIVAVAERGKKLVDGRGVERISEIVRGLF